MNVVVAIPVYRIPESNELISLRRCCKILRKYDIVLVCPVGFDMLEYKNVFYEYDVNFAVEYFDEKYFESIDGYNRLLLSEIFYLRFKKYEYLLIYQLDAYVFSDDLEYWCGKGYDYVGAPLLGGGDEKVYNDDMLTRVGNGGFSLRRIQTYIDYFNGEKHVFNASQIVKHISLWKKPYTRIFVWILMMFGWRNTPEVVAARYKRNEDVFWSLYLNGSNYSLKKPTPNEAMYFAFERFPSSLYRITKKLPFGCHAWAKYEYLEFWKDYIK